jgi:4-hydroxymandelate oxidase
MAVSPSTDFSDLMEAERRARERLPEAVWDYARAGADDGLTADANIAAWGAIRLRPHVLRGVSAARLSTRLLGTPVSMPIVASPTGKQRMFHAEGELATARAFAGAGALMILSSGASDLIEPVASAAPGAPRWMQLYIERDRALTAETIERASAAGFSAVVLTVDVARGGRPRLERPDVLPEVPTTVVEPEPALSLEDVAWLRASTPLPVVVKGVLRGDDAAACVNAGAAALVVSNHGGNQLDTVVTTAEALPEVIEAVGGRAEVYVDGGIRRGTSVLKALALGARAVLVGRPVIYGLAVGGSEGVAAMLGCLERELRRAMHLCGAPTLADLTPDLIHP